MLFNHICSVDQIVVSAVPNVQCPLLAFVEDLAVLRELLAELFLENLLLLFDLLDLLDWVWEPLLLV